MKKWLVGICFLIICPWFVSASLVNINTADQAELENLTGVGPVIAGRIVEYRNTVGAFKMVEELKNVKGIGEATFAKLKREVTIGGDISSSNVEADSSDQDLAASVHSKEVGATNFSAEGFKIGAGRERLATVRTPIVFSVVQNKRGEHTNYFVWSFGDGTSAVGGRVQHAYQFPGHYTVVVNGSIDNKEEAVARTTVTVVESRVKVTAVDLAAGFVEISNGSDQEQNLNGWNLQVGNQNFVFPLDTIVEAKSAIKVPLELLGLPRQNVTKIVLAYPDGLAASGANLEFESIKEEEVGPVVTEKNEEKPIVAKAKVDPKLASRPKNVITLTKEPNWFERIKNAIF